MVGSVGMVRGVSRPGSLVIQEALNLLSALGSNSEGTTKKLLTEMKGIQDNNEVVLADAKAAVIEANKREAEVVEEEAELARNLEEAEKLYAERLADIISGEDDLQRRVEEADARVSVENNSIKKREDEFHREQEEQLEARRVSIESLIERERVLKEDRDDLRVRESSLEIHKDTIKLDEIKLDEFGNSLDKRSAKLDLRDARLRAAMEDEVVVEGE